ncbi:MAG: class I SAM-dependent methyltransferase, partial [Porphyromonadaceae bacterium]|nr:class I SAM-dependent methyltransferase [Porphyromonadaceae bacterium]
MNNTKFYNEFRKNEKPNMRHAQIHRHVIALGLKQNMNVLDVGCGEGIVSAMVAFNVLPKGKVLGIDTSEGRIERANSGDSKRSNITFKCMEFTDLPDEKVFDVIMFNDVLE